MLIGQLLGIPVEGKGTPTIQLVSNSFIGVEVELERVPDVNIVGWEVKIDGSLRDGGKEFVFNRPKRGIYAVRALERFEAAIQDLPDPPVISSRTSTHIHIDVRDLTPEELSNLIKLLVIFELPLIRYWGPVRWRNHFCLPYYECPQGLGLLRCLNNQMSNKSLYYNVLKYGMKYNNINLKTINTFGSLEVRCGQGTWSKVKLLEWINILLSFKVYVQEHTLDVLEMLQRLSEDGPVLMLEKIAGPELAQALLYTKEEFESDVYKGVRLIQESEFNEEYEETAETLRKRNFTSDNLLNKFYEKHGMAPKFSKKSYEDLLNIINPHYEVVDEDDNDDDDEDDMDVEYVEDDEGRRFP